MNSVGPKPWSTDTVRVFVSSTFKDLAAERDHLIVAVYPELEERLAQLDLILSDIDLRWGVPPREEQETEPANVWAYCRRCINESAPIFLSLLGHRYGSIAPDDQLLASERRRWSGLSMTELEIRYALHHAHRARLRPIFLLRETLAPPESAPEFRDADLARITELRNEIEVKFAPTRYACEWSGGAFVELDPFGGAALDLVWAAILRSTDFVPRNRWRAVFAKHVGARRALAGTGPIPKEYWEALIARQPHTSQLQRERRSQRQFISERLRWYYGGAAERADLSAFVNDRRRDAPRLCLVAAPPGAGKTSLLARFVQERPANEICISHFVGAIERSASERDLLVRISEELAAAGLAPAPSSGDIKALRDRFINFLSSYRGRRKLVIIIDGVNQLPSDSQTAWIPHVLGPQVRLILSCAVEPSTAALIDDLHNRGARRIEVHPLTPDLIRLVAASYFDDYGKTLEPSVLNRVADMESACNPLYLITLLGELRETPGSAPLEDRLKLLDHATRELTTAVALFRYRLRRLEVFGNSEMRAWCQALLASRSGFTASQLAAFLSQSCGEASANSAHRIRRALRRVLLMRGLRTDFYHGELRAAAEAEYAITDHKALHSTLARALTGLAHEGDQYALEQLVHHWVKAKDWTTALSILENEDELERRLNGGDAAYRLCLEFDNAYRAAFADGAEPEAQKIVASFLAALAAERVRARGLSITAANAWLSYGQGHRFIRVVLEAGARLQASDAEQSRLSLDCRGILAGLIRRESRLQEAEQMLQEITPPVRTGAVARVLDRFAGLMPLSDIDQGRRDGRNAYEMAYVHFLRGDLQLARSWFLHSSRLSRRSDDKVGASISSCLAANCDFISRRRPPKVMRIVLKRANRVFQKYAVAGDPNADRWTWTVANHLFETAFADNDRELARRYFDGVAAHTWPARYGYSGGKMGGDQMSINVGLLKPHRARLAMVEGKYEEAVSLFAECFERIDLSPANKTEAAARIALDFGDALEKVGRMDAALDIWERALLLPADQGNMPWQALVRQRIDAARRRA